MGEMVQWSGAVGHCGFIHKILVLQETWCNPERSMDWSVCLFLTCSGILALEHGWVSHFPHSFQLPELRGYRNSPASWSRVIGHLSPGSFFSPLQLPQYPSMSLFRGLVRQYLIDDYTTCFLIRSCFPVLASVNSGCFSISRWSLAWIGCLSPWAHQSHPPPGMEPRQRPQPLLFSSTSILTSNLFT